MHVFRAFIRTHRRLVAGLVALALALKLIVPVGYMLGAQAHVLTVEICADSQGGRLVQKIVVPGGGEAADHTKSDAACAWSASAMLGLSGANGPLLALALAFILLLGFAPARRLDRHGPAYLRPPLRGPPTIA